jgi:hypothetical protein
MTARLLYRTGIPAGSVERALRLGACEEGCDPLDVIWNTHFQIVNGTAYAVLPQPPTLPPRTQRVACPERPTNQTPRPCTRSGA